MNIFIMMELSLWPSFVDFEILALVGSDHLPVRAKIELNLEKTGGDEKKVG